ncbi:MAG: hypothetical protein ACOYMG_21935 [Candidatus Methylumidiphilus sp.]
MKRRYPKKPLSKEESARLQQQMKALYGLRTPGNKTMPKPIDEG